jgi:RNA-binding motif X-linked protein 2
MTLTWLFLFCRPPEASWHADYRDSAYINIGGLPFDLSEGDIVTIFSQFGEPVHVNLIRDKETGKSRGFAFLKYEDQRSTDLAVDNLGGATVMGRVLRVDHTRYKRREDEGEEDNVASLMGPAGGTSREKHDDTDERTRRRRSDADEKPRPMLKEEIELAELLRDHDEEDPMKEYLVQEKKEEVARALEELKSKSSSRRHRRPDEHRERSSKHRHHRHRRSENRSRSRERSRRDRGETSRRDREYRDRSDYADRR